jgi:hypothetical protein
VLDAEPEMEASLEAFLANPRDREYYGSRMRGRALRGDGQRVWQEAVFSWRAEVVAVSRL